MKHKKFHTVKTVKKSNDRRNMGESDSPNAYAYTYIYIHIHDRSPVWLGTDTSIKSGGLL